MTNKQLSIFIGIFLFSLATKVYQLGEPSTYYFDEIYHGFTAGEMVKGNKDVYDPWAKNPPGKANEWTHPPLGKLLIAVPIAVLGDDPVSRRVSSVFFGIAASLLAGLLSYILFESINAALFAFTLLSLDGLFFSHSRIAMIDTHFSFFSLICLNLFAIWVKRTLREFRPTLTLIPKKKSKKVIPQITPLADFHLRILFGVAIGAGLALATKWTAFYLLGFLGAFLTGLAIVHKPLRNWKLISIWILSLTVIPISIYLLSYIQYFYLGYNWAQFVELQHQMWWYHTNLTATHNYASHPYAWVLDLRPVWLWVKYGENNKISNIYDLGNPVLFYVGLGTMVYFCWKFWKRHSWTLIFLVASYLTFWAPWMLSPRIMFFYHYLPAVPMLAIAMGWLLDQARQSENRWKFTGGSLAFALCFLWFVLFFPDLTGIPVSRSFADRVYGIVPGWK